MNTHNVASFPLFSSRDFKQKTLQWAADFPEICLLDHNHYPLYPQGTFRNLLALGNGNNNIQPQSNSFDALKQFVNQSKDWIFGHINYDVKNEIENLQSNNFDGLGFANMHFFIPEILFDFYPGYVIIYSKESNPHHIFKAILKEQIEENTVDKVRHFFPRMKKKKYLENVASIQEHILEGDVYEMNLCQEFYSTHSEIDPLASYLKLNEISQAPFSSFYKLNENYLICASPERFLKKEKQHLFAQPIKGTVQRGKNRKEDLHWKKVLLKSEKDRAEHVMIVDLMRNDLSKSCKAGSVQVEELFGIYGFEQVYQMISTITGELNESVHCVDAIKSAFPMGSMTGAPKVMSMELIEQYECSKRGLYSGTVGYISPNRDFDFNVVIRSILYNQKRKYLSFQVGGAIVYDSVPEKEYEECLLKAKGILKALHGEIVEDMAK